MKMIRQQPHVSRAIIRYTILLAFLTLLGWDTTKFNLNLPHSVYPANWPLYDPTARYSDLTNYRAMLDGLWNRSPLPPEEMPMYNYPAPALFVYSFFFYLFPDPIRAFLLFGQVVWFSGFAILLRHLRSGWTTSLAVLVTGIFAYPFQFTMDRGNIEIAVFSLVAVGLILFVRQWYWMAALAFAFAACLKPFPILFLYLFLRKQKYREIAFTVFWIAFINLLSLWWMGPTIPGALATLTEGTTIFLNDYVTGYRVSEIGFDHSLFACIKQAMRVANGRKVPTSEALALAYRIYAPLAGAFVIWCGWHFRKKPILNQLFAVVIVMITFSPVSYDYTLLHAYLLWGAFLICITTDGSVARPLWFLIPFAVLMAPESYLHTVKAGFGGQVKTVALMILLYLSATVDLPSKLFVDGPEIKSATS